MANKESISFRLTPEAIALIKQLAKKLGVSQADIVEMAIRKKAEEEGVKIEDG
jgi:predicted DNA-binding protein